MHPVGAAAGALDPAPAPRLSEQGPLGDAAMSSALSRYRRWRIAGVGWLTAAGWEYRQMATRRDCEQCGGWFVPRRGTPGSALLAAGMHGTASI
jgi:hypothetical protein